MKIAGAGLWKITVQRQEQDVGEQDRVSFHLVTQDKGAASDEHRSPYSHAGWSMGCYGMAVCVGGWLRWGERDSNLKKKKQTNKAYLKTSASCLR